MKTIFINNQRASIFWAKQLKEKRGDLKLFMYELHVLPGDGSDQTAIKFMQDIDDKNTFRFVKVYENTDKLGTIEAEDINDAKIKFESMFKKFLATEIERKTAILELL